MVTNLLSIDGIPNLVTTIIFARPSGAGNLIHKEMCSRTVNVNAEREHERANTA